MVLTELELRLCAGALGYTHLNGFGDLDSYEGDSAKNIQGQDYDVIKSKLSENRILEMVDGKYRFPAIGQLMIRMIAEPDAWFICSNREKSVSRRFYVLGADYLCIDEEDGRHNLILLPLLPLAMGGCAKMLEDVRPPAEGLREQDLQDLWEKESCVIHLEGLSGERYLSIDVSGKSIMKKVDGGETAYALFSEEGCVNSITKWLLQGLKEKGDEIDVD